MAIIFSRSPWVYAVALLLVSGMIKSFLPDTPTYLDISLLPLLVIIFLMILNYKAVIQRLGLIGPYARGGLWALVALTLLMTLSYGYTASPFESQSKLFLFYLLPVYVLAGICVPRSGIPTIVALTCLATFFAIGYVLTHAESIVMERQGPDGNLAVLSLYLTASLYCGFCALMLLGGAIDIGPTLRLSIAVIMIGAMLLLGGRGPTLALLASLSIVWMQRLPKAGHQMASFFVTAVGTIIIAGAIIAALSTASPDGFALLFDRAIDRFGSLTDLDSSQSFLERQAHFTTIEQAFLKSPKDLFFGFGIGSYGLERYGMDVFAHPHNIFMEVFYETGIAGILLLIIMLILFGVAIWRTLNGYGAGIFVFLVLNAAKSSSVVEQRVMFIILGLLIVYCIGQYQRSDQRV